MIKRTSFRVPLAIPTFAATVLAILIAPPCWGQVDAVTKARHDLKLGFTVDGKVVRVLVKSGERVEEGQLLMELYDEEGKSLVNLYKLRARSDLEMQSGKAALRLAQVEERSIRQLFENNAAKPIEVERAQITTIQAKLELEMAQQRGKEAILQLEQARARHREYELRATKDGIIDQVIVAEGELITKLEPVLRLVVTDPLWVDVAVPTGETLDIKVNATAWVQSHLPGHEKPMRGKILHLAEVADAASDTRLVRIEVPNPHGLPAGGQVTVTFHGPGTETTTATSSNSTRRVR